MKCLVVLNFYKYEGAGNDFILLPIKSLRENLHQEPSDQEIFDQEISERALGDLSISDTITTSKTLTPALTRFLCDRHHGVGADGLVTYYPLPSTGNCTRWRLQIYNSDGERASLCGNALRCLSAHLSQFHKLNDSHIIVSDCNDHLMQPVASPLKKDFFTEATNSLKWIKTSMGQNHPLQLDLPSSIIDLQTSRKWLDPKHIHCVDWVDSGVPHLIFVLKDSQECPCPSLESLNLQKFGNYWRHHPHLQPHGANVSLAIWQTDTPLIHLRTYERGVEAPTLSCGTGACASAISFWMRHPLLRSLSVKFHHEPAFLLECGPVNSEQDLPDRTAPSYSAPSSPLTLSPLTESRAVRSSQLKVELTGPARFVFKGML